MTQLATIIFAIPPSRVENETYFSIAGIFTSSQCANLSIGSLGNLLFINTNSDPRNPTPKTTPHIISSPIELLQDIFENA